MWSFVFVFFLPFLFFVFISLYIFLIFCQILVADIMWGRLHTIVLYKQNKMFYFFFVFFFFFSKIILNCDLFSVLRVSSLHTNLFSTKETTNCMWFISLKLVVCSRGDAAMPCWFGFFCPAVKGQTRGGADTPPLPVILQLWITSVSPHSNGEVLGSLECPRIVNLIMEVVKGAGRWLRFSPRWAAELRACVSGALGDSGSWLWRRSSPLRLPQDHRCSWTRRYCCQNSFHRDSKTSVTNISGKQAN